MNREKADSVLSEERNPGLDKISRDQEEFDYRLLVSDSDDSSSEEYEQYKDITNRKKSAKKSKGLGRMVLEAYDNKNKES